MDHHTQDNPQAERAEARLRCGVILDGGRIESWQAGCLAELRDRAGVIVELVVVFPRSSSHSGWRSRARSSALLADAGVVSGKPRLNCAPRERPDGLYVLAESEVSDIRRRDLDFIIDFGNRPLAGKALESATYGIWCFSFGDPGIYPDGQPGLREILLGDPVAQARLIRLGMPGRAAVLRRGVFPVSRDSAAATVDRLQLGVAAWPAQACVDLANGCAGYLTDPVYHTHLHNLRPLGAGEALGLSFRLPWERLKRLVRSVLQAEEWNVGVVKRPIQSFLHFSDGYRVEWLGTPQRGTFIADPFGIEQKGVKYAYYEDFSYDDRCGVISGGVLDGDPPEVRDARPVIETGQHLSYPYLIEEDGQVYCIPEAHKAGQTLLFKAVELPHRWEYAATLLEDIGAIDPTVFRHDGRWWLLFVTKDPRTQTELLQAWYAEHLEGPWEPHANNPLKADVHATRPGGTPFNAEGELYRPVQDCGETYGRRILINRVIRLTPTEFEEETVSGVEPPKGQPWSKGMHTLAAVGDWTLVDAKRFVFVPAVLRQRLASVFARFTKSRKRNTE